ncbi:MAG: 4Fe-4S ferredoxin, partial [Xanthobacteraceae bacterium]
MEKRTILVCSCEDTMPLDADAIGRGCCNADVKTARQLCRAEIERFRAAVAGGEAVTVGCTQEAPLFSEVAAESGGTISFVNVRETAG